MSQSGLVVLSTNQCTLIQILSSQFIIKVETARRDKDCKQAGLQPDYMGLTLPVDARKQENCIT